MFQKIPINQTGNGIVFYTNKSGYKTQIFEKAVNEIAQLPGIGKRTALRLALHLLKVPKENTFHLTQALNNLREQINFCSSCHNLSDLPLCEICSNPSRDDSLICVVE